MFMMCVVLSVWLGGLVTHSEAWYKVIPYSLYFADMKMMYLVLGVLGVWLAACITHSEGQLWPYVCAEGECPPATPLKDRMCSNQCSTYKTTVIFI